jgi:hypothetical protein
MGAFESHMEREGFSPNTVKAFMSDLSILSQFTGAGRAVGEIGTRDLTDYLDWLQHGRDVPCNAKSLARRLKAARMSIATGAISGAVGTFANIDPSVEAYVAEKMGLTVEPVSTQVIPRDRHAMYFATLAVIAVVGTRRSTCARRLRPPHE